ncbi:DNA replication complex GINS protein SLD5 [Citrus sinensis]|uniref:DNA replication complex GINS protein SLD5 n=1 Tax=Citrus sinensis TaxID=2711 RepID=UPI0003D761CD|nr:DNA replication complex GINS protein SLD5 [Citrus sinensis]KAH9766221.1 DNA replication complex GINS protein SLD5 [Citrus sinensis]
MAEDTGDGSTAEMDDYETLMSTTDAELLKTAWRNEKAAPEILQFQAPLVKRAKEQIQLMEETVEEYEESGMDPLTVSLYQMDLDRAQFLLRSYLRVRLQKLEKYMFYIWKNESLWSRLSDPEKMFVQRCIDDMEKHLEETVLSKLPDNYQSVRRQSVISEEDDMVPEPQLDTFIACKARNRFVSLRLADSERPLEMERHDVSFVLYKVIEDKIGADIDLV